MICLVDRMVDVLNDSMNLSSIDSIFGVFFNLSIRYIDNLLVIAIQSILSNISLVTNLHSVVSNGYFGFSVSGFYTVKFRILRKFRSEEHTSELQSRQYLV